MHYSQERGHVLNYRIKRGGLMSAQVADCFKYKGEKYDIVAGNGPLPFRPQSYGITPKSICSACWDGYWCDYIISDKGIVLENIYVNSEDNNYPKINGVAARRAARWKRKERSRCMGHHFYKGVNIKIPYTGNLFLGKDFMRKYYIHLGYQRPWAYKESKEFIFEKGMLIDVIDHSTAAEEVRKRIEEDPDFYPEYDGWKIFFKK